ncbi:MAG: hypothetical protein WEB58_12335 [Planctomycetaceae bacterium]
MRAQAISEAEQSIIELGGGVNYFSVLPGHLVEYAPKNLTKLVSRRQVYFIDIDLRVDDIRQLRRALEQFGSVDGLSLCGQYVDNLWLENLPGKARVETLILGETNVTADGLMELKRWPSLDLLVLESNKKTDDESIQELIDDFSRENVPVRVFVKGD